MKKSNNFFYNFTFNLEGCCLFVGPTQVDDSGHRIPQERCGKVTVSWRKASETAGTWKQYSDRSRAESIGKISGPDCLTWVASIASSAYSIDYIFKNMPIEMRMKKRTDKIFITLK
jgi:hypothetical protein